MTIAGNPAYFSLNLAQAVQVVAYELYSQTEADLSHLVPQKHPATHDQVAGMTAHMAELMDEIGFFNRRNSPRIIRRLHNLFARAKPETEDIDLMRGFFNTVGKRLKDKRG